MVGIFTFDKQFNRERENRLGAFSLICFRLILLWKFWDFPVCEMRNFNFFLGFLWILRKFYKSWEVNGEVEISKKIIKFFGSLEK